MPDDARGAARAVTYPFGRLTLRTREMERLIVALRTDFGCFVIIVAFVVIMISAIVFANILTPPASNPLL
ncbi:MAG: hypothetical protein WB807_03520 [Candidatus Dormiibacterota bacterium]